MPGSRKSEPVHIPSDVQKRLDRIRREQHQNLYRWAEWQDAVIRQCWTDKAYVKAEIATEVLGVCYNTALKRARELGVAE